jgi:uncharacterized NAD-dependent epimerase/dehydratase family protein
MLQPEHKLAIYFGGHLDNARGKLGHGLLRFSQHTLVCAIDPSHAGATTDRVVGYGPACPVVDDVAAALALGADVLVLGTAPSGGLLPGEWLPDIDAAVAAGMSVVNGLHDLIADRYTELADGQWMWDIRRPPASGHVATARAAELTNQRLLLVGTDTSIGKMTTGLILHRAARARGVNAAFCATGQIGICITGRGIPLDCIRVDFAAGAVEDLVLAEAAAELVFIEGQGSLLHPGSTAALPLLRGSCPTHLILCHRPTRTHIDVAPHIAIPPLPDVIRLYEDLAAPTAAYIRPRTVAVALNTCDLDEAAARAAVAGVAADTGLACDDVVRFGPDRLLAALD